MRRLGFFALTNSWYSIKLSSDDPPLLPADAASSADAGVAAGTKWSDWLCWRISSAVIGSRVFPFFKNSVIFTLPSRATFLSALID